MKLKLVTIVLLVVELCFGRAAFAEDKETQIIRETKIAYVSVPEAKVCIDNIQKHPEIALGFCYSWYKQTLTKEQKAAASVFLATAFKAIESGIISERD